MTSWFTWFVTGAGSKALGKCTWMSKNACPIGIGQLPPRKRKKQEIEIYLQDHYQTWVKPLVDAETDRQIKIEGKPLDKGSKLKLLKTVMKEVFESEDQATRDVISQKALTQPSPYPKEELKGKVVCTPENLLRYFTWLFIELHISLTNHSAIEDLTAVLPQVLDKFCWDTKGFGMVIFGGPNPAIGGQIKTLRYLKSFLFHSSYVMIIPLWPAMTLGWMTKG